MLFQYFCMETWHLHRIFNIHESPVISGVEGGGDVCVLLRRLRKPRWSGKLFLINYEKLKLAPWQQGTVESAGNFINKSNLTPGCVETCLMCQFTRYIPFIPKEQQWFHQIHSIHVRVCVCETEIKENEPERHVASRWLVFMCFNHSAFIAGTSGMTRFIFSFTTRELSTP